MQISTCSVWLDGQDRNYMTFSGTNVTTWKDKSGTGNDATATGNISNTPSINGNYAMILVVNHLVVIYMKLYYLVMC